MTQDGEAQPHRGQALVGAGGQRIGIVDAVFADYLLVRTSGVLPVDLYVPRVATNRDDAGRLAVESTPAQAYEAWHRPLKRVDHD
ncbi:MAG TPA: hypothetical protein VF013_04575 [Candidatus Limnocylindria bacterium]